MDAIAVLFVVIAVVGAIVKNANKTAKKRPGQAVPPAQRAQRQKTPAANPRRVRTDRPIAWDEAFPPEVREVLVKGRVRGAHTAPKPAAGEAAKPAPDVSSVEARRRAYMQGDTGGSLPHERDGEGKSRAFDDGCVGGSLPHEKPAASAERPRPQAKEPAPVLMNAVSPSQDRPRLSAAQMRRAVVMAEVLARPVSLRPRGHRL